MDLKKNRLAIAIALFAALLGTTLFLLKKRRDADAAPETTASNPLPAVARDAIAEVTIERPNQPAVKLAKRGDTFRMIVPVDAATDTSAVEAVLEKLSTLEFVTIAATNAANHARLEVDDAHAIHVVAKGANGNALIDLRLGAYRGGNTLVRVNGGADVLALRGAIKYAFNKDAREFRDRTIVQVEPAHVRALSIASDQGTFRFERNAANEWTETVARGQHPIEHFSATKVDSLVSTLARLRAADFAAAGAETGLATPRSTITLTVREDAEADGGTPTSEEITLLLGGPAGPSGTDGYLAKRGSDVTYVVPSFVVERLRPSASAFQPEADAGTPAPPAPPSEMPGGGAGQLPPELLEQLMRQATSMGGGDPHAGHVH